MLRILKFECLEARQMLSSTTWSGGSGNWTDPTKWSNGVPTALTDAVLNPTAQATITIQPGETDYAQNLTIDSNATLTLPLGGDTTNPASNALVNPGFESPAAANSTTSPATWWCWGLSYVSTQYAHTGSQSLVLSGSNSGVAEPFTFAAGNSYTASVYAMTPAANPLVGGAGAYLQILFFDSSGATIDVANDSFTMLTASSTAGGPLAGSVGNQGWNHFYTTAVAPSNAKSAQVQLELYSNDSTTGAVYCDDMEFGPAATGGPSKLVADSISNRGTLVVGPANTVTDSGQFAQSSTGTLDIQLGGAPSTGSFGFLDASGAAQLAGTLRSAVLNGYSPSTTDTFTAVEYASVTGSFAGETMPGGSGYQFNAAVTFTNLMISAAPTTALTATVNASASLHAATTNLLGVNMVYWDPDTGTTQTQQLIGAAGLDMFRFPGGSASDDYHFTDADNYYDGSQTFVNFIEAIAADGGTGLVTIDYGSGSPQEAAAELAYLDGSPADPTVIGNGIQWNDTTHQWQTVNWQTVGYWAALRGASPLVSDDGLNFLRIDHPAAFSNIKYWEVGNEEYGSSWEIDHHGTAGPGGVSTGAAHDPATYAAFAKQFATFATEIQAAAGLPAISIGIDSDDPTGTDYNDWTTNVLKDGLADGFVPGFISDHSYMQAPFAESDTFLLNDTVSDAGSVLDWSTRYADYETLLQQTVGSQAAGVQITATEYNSVYTTPGKQSTSLVNGLFVAESLGGLLDSGFSAGILWDMCNSYDTSSDQNDSPGLYGWREGGDYGILGDPNSNAAPASGPYIAYPNYYAMQLASKIIQNGGQVVSATSNYSDLDVYAVTLSNGHLDLLVVNTNPAASLTENFNLTGFQPAGPAEIWQYGETQDTAQSLTTTGASALANSNTTVSLSGGNFSYAFPAYSMTVLDLTPQVLTSIAVALASNNLATTGIQQFSAAALDQFHNPLDTQPAFNWSVAGGGQIDGSGNFMPPYTSGSATISATNGTVTGSTTVTYPGAAEWNSAAPGSWTASVWSGSTSGASLSPPGLRGVAGDTVLFVSAGTTVSLNGATPSLAGMTFNNAAGYTIAAGTGGTIQLNNGASPAALTVSSGSHTIAAPLVLQSSVNIVPASGSTLSISAVVSGGESLTLDAPGTLVLSGANTYSGGTLVLAGTLVLTGSNALLAGSSLTVAAGGILVLDSSAVGSSPVQVAGVSDSNASASVAPRAAPPPLAPPARATSTEIRHKAIAAWLAQAPRS